jgi:PAS domain S-box-containing protein
VTALPQLLPIRVLLVEDNPGDARLIIEMLKEVAGDEFALEQVDRLEPALQRLGSAGADVVLLDLGLPDSTGLATFQRAQRNGSGEPIVVISGRDDEGLALDAVRAGAQDYLVKGRIEGQLLARVIRYAIERNRVADRLRWLTLAVEQSPASVFITDPKGTIEFVNARFTAVTGYAPNEAIGRTPRILKSGLTPREYYDALWKTILGGHTWRAEVQNRRKNGEIYWDSVVISPIRNARGEIVHFLAVQEDITRRKDAERELRDRDERFSQLAENIREAFFVVDAQYREMLYISPAYQAIWGRSCASLYERPASFLEGILPDDRARVAASIAQVQAGNAPPEIEFRVVKPDGEVRWVLTHAVPVRNSKGEVYRIAGVVLDITQRHEAEQALQARETHYRTILEQIGDAVFVADAEGRFVDVNPRASELTGYSRDELLGMRVSDTYPLDAQVDAEDRLAAARRGTIAVAERRLLRKDGTVITVETYARPLPEGRMLGTARDVTERLALEQQLRQAQKMEAVGRLAGGVAHDFNNLLTAIFGYADFAMEELPATSSAREDIEEIRKAALRASTLTRQLLAFSRQQVLEPVVLNMNELVGDLNKMLRRLIGEDVELRQSLAADLGNVKADHGQLQQVLMNLVVNARDAMPTGGRLSIETANAELSRQYAEQHQPVIPGQYVMLAVSDTGTGMTPETKARIFEPFFTTKEKGKGTGLGLSTVYGIVKQSGGYVWVYSELGRGTTFKIYLPRVDEAAMEIAQRREPGTLTGTETILLAEDDGTLRALAAEALAKLGYTVLAAANGPEALATAAAHTGPIHLLVTDVVMPGLSGRGVAQQLGEVRPDTRVLYISGYTDDAIVHHGMLAPGLSFLQKPFTPAALARKVREVLESG